MLAVGIALAGIAVSWIAACARAPRMCIAAADCGGESSCVAGRCLRRGAVAAVTTAHRWLYAPVDVAVVTRAASTRSPAEASSSTATFGGQQGQVLLLRFAMALAPEASILEAYLVLNQARDVQPDPDPIALHAARITEPWDGRSATWAKQPRVVEVGAPVTRVLPFMGHVVRLDVREIVQRWRRRPGEDFGVAVAADGRSATGITIALRPLPETGDRSVPMAVPLDPHATGAQEAAARLGDRLDGPELELYVK